MRSDVFFLAEGELTPTSYIQHHLKHLAVKTDFGAFHIDTIITSLILGLVMLFGFWLVLRKVSSGVPGKWQAFVEIVLEFLNTQVKDAYHGKSKLVAPIAITLFVWILLMNLIKLIPADFVAIPLHALGIDYFRYVPSADVNATLAMSLTVFFLMLFFAIRAKGAGGFVHEIFTAPFGAKMFPANILLNFVELLSKPLSLAMRLFGNMYGGELVFLLIWVLSASGIVGALAGATLGFGWALFHFLVIPLQAFVFMMLSVVYLSLMEEHH
jgi:F-type H+-transporting ATPase subunit a